MDYAHIVTQYFDTPWAIQPEKLAIMTDILMARVAGERATSAEIQERIGAAQSRQGQQAGNVAVIPVVGVVSQRMNMFSEYSGGVSTQLLADRIRKAVADPDVGAILLDVDSPGGSVFGVQEVAEVIYKARGQKKIVAHANSLAASAAYWIASAADEVVVTPGGEVGSIGVIMAHADWSAYIDKPEAGMAGLPKVTYITAGKYKSEGNPYEGLSEEAITFYEKRVGQYYDAFTKSVARNRADSPANVREGYGQARVLGAKDAKAENLVDRIEPFDETLSRLMTPRGQRINTAKAKAAMAATDMT